MKERNSNFELMRIVSMLFIVLFHIIKHGRMIENCNNNIFEFFLQMIMFLTIVHVNSFVLLSGYFQSKSKFKLSKLLSLFLQVVFYASLTYYVAIKLGFISNYNFVTIFNKFTFSVFSEYWFIQVYVIVYIFSDYINKFIDRLSRVEFKNLLLLLFLIFSVMSFITGGRFLANTGFNFYNFIFLYMIGGYLRRYPLRDTYHFKRFSRNGYMCIMIFIFLIMAIFNFFIFFFVRHGSFNGDIIFTELVRIVNYSKYSYSTPFVIIQTICYFEIFRMISIKSKLINFVSSCTFGIYLFHDSDIARGNIYKLLKIDNGFALGYDMVTHMFCVLMFIFVVGLIIEIARKMIFYLLNKFILIKKVKSWFKSFVESFNFNIQW